ncbi:MAG: TolC family outer membrane protein [Paracoccaceae bacterium]
MIDVIQLIRFSIFNIWLIILIFLFSLSSNLRADSLDEILKLTFSSNKQLLLSRIKLQASKSAIDISKAALGLSFSASFNGSKGWNINESSNSDSYSSSLIGNYNLLDGNLSKSKVLIDEALYKIAKFQLYELEQKVLLDTINAYLNVLRDQKFVELSNNNVAVLERQFLEISDRFKLGEVTRTDVSQAESALAAAKANLTAKNGSLKISSEMFLSLVGIKPFKLKNIISNFKLPKTIEIAKQNSLKKHSKIMVADIEELIARIRIDIAKSQKSPLINFKSIFSNGYSSSSGNNNSVTFRLEGSLPIFSSGKIENEISQAKINYKAQKESSLLVKRLVEQDIALAWSNVLVSKASIEARKRQVEASSLAYDGVLVEEKLGTRTTLDVINAEQSLLDARTQLASAERELIYAKFSLLAATGELNLKKLNIAVPKIN